MQSCLDVRLTGSRTLYDAFSRAHSLVNAEEQACWCVQQQKRAALRHPLPSFICTQRYLVCHDDDACVWP